MDIIGRTEELQVLTDAARGTRGQLVFVWGRRRLGKTYLLQAFGSDQLTIFHAATERAQAIELQDFTHTVRDVLGAERIPEGYSFPDWGVALTEVGRLSPDRRVVVILDEFLYLEHGSPGLASVIQKWWDHYGKSSNVMLILCGSDVTYMHQLSSGDQPLSQRATVRLHVKPFDYRSAGLFIPQASLTDRAYAYGILGGIPLFLEAWNDRWSVNRNLEALFGRASSPLVDAADQMLGRDAPSYEGSYRILEAIAHGKTRTSEIAARSQLTVDRPLRRLVETEILERCAPIDENAVTSRRTYYRIKDSYLRLWFRYLATGRAEIARGLGQQVVNRIAAGLDDLMGEVFEEMAREHVRGLVAEGKLEADRIGRWWSSDSSHEIDIVGMLGKKVTFVGSVKWRKDVLGWPILNELDAHAAAMGAGTIEVPRILVGRGGVARELVKDSRVLPVSLEDMYG